MSQTKPTNPKDRAATNRLDLSLFPATAKAYGALAFQEGDFKYGGYNWREAGVLSSVYYAAANRHLDKWFNGENEDPDTGVPHLANALACIAVLIDSIECRNLNDDRPPRCDMPGILRDMETRVARLREKLHKPGSPPRCRHKPDKKSSFMEVMESCQEHLRRNGPIDRRKVKHSPITGGFRLNQGMGRRKGDPK